MITIINEKKEQADRFADALGGRSGTLGPNYTLQGSYTIDEAAGHIISLQDLKDMVPEDEQKDFTTWSFDLLPFNRNKITFKLQPNPDCGGRGADYYLKQFKKDLALSDAAVIATDNDPSGEGDLIGWEILEYLHFDGDVYRCLHQDETATKVQDAFAHLKLIRKRGQPYNDPALDKAIAQHTFDYLTIQYTMGLNDIARKAAVIPAGYVSRTGRDKASMIELVGRQERLHDYFKPHSDFQPALYDQDRHRFTKYYKNKDDAVFYSSEDEAAKHLPEVPQNAHSMELGVKQLAQKPPKMLNLSQVAARLASKGYSPRLVNELAEKLFLADILSYPRTEDTRITDTQLAELLPLVPKICKLVGVDPALIDIDHYRPYLIGTNLQHGANRPGVKVPDSMDELRRDYGDTACVLYEELARSFLAGFGSDKLSEKHIYVDDETKSYVATATVVTDPGYSLILKEVKEDTGKEPENNQLFNVGQPLKPDVWEKKATRPRLATQSMLTSYLKKHNIGTGATQLSIFLDITNDKDKTRQLVKIQKGSLRLTKLGQIGYILMYGTILANPKTTKQLYDYLALIAKHKMSKEALLRFFDKMFVHDKDIMLHNHKNLASLPKVKQITHKEVKGIYQPTGEEKTIKDGLGTYQFTQQQIVALFNGDSISFPYGKAKVTGKLAERENYGFGFQANFEYPQPEKATGYSKVTKADVSFNKTFAGHTFTQTEIDTLLDGDLVNFKGKSKKGKTYTAKVHLVYGELYKSKTHKKVWHIAFVDNKK